MTNFSNLTRTEVAACFGVTPPAVTFWKKAGCPVKLNGRYSAPEVHKWLLDRESISAEASSSCDSPNLERYRAARAAMAELDLKERSGELISMEDVKEAWVQRVAWVRISLDNLKDRLPPLLEGMTRHEMRRIIDDACEFIAHTFARHGGYTPEALAAFDQVEEYLRLSMDEQRAYAAESNKIMEEAQHD